MTGAPDPDQCRDGADRAATLLHRTGEHHQLIDSLPAEIVPATRAAAYAVQARRAELTGQATVGWKIAATSEAGQRHINVAGPMGGRVLADHVYRDGDVLPLAGNAMCLAEVEFAFVFGPPIEPRDAPYSTAEVLASVVDLRLGIELPSTRYADTTTVGEIQLIADNACGLDFLLGPVAPGTWRSTDLATVTVSARAEGPSGPRDVEGRGASVLGNPLDALTWLVNELSSLGTSLDAGQFVTTGTCCVPIPVAPGDRLTAQFGGLGTVTCSFADTLPTHWSR